MMLEDGAQTAKINTKNNPTAVEMCKLKQSELTLVLIKLACPWVRRQILINERTKTRRSPAPRLLKE